jgi:hypothetical protein
MNQRIKELAVRADKIVKSQHPNADMTTGVVIMMDVFAELIVRECAEKVDWILAEGGKTQGDLIKQHFGVDTKIDTNKKIEESLHKADKDIQEGLRKQYLEQLTRLNGDLS